MPLAIRWIQPDHITRLRIAIMLMYVASRRKCATHEIISIDPHRTPSNVVETENVQNVHTEMYMYRKCYRNLRY